MIGERAARLPDATLSDARSRRASGGAAVWIAGTALFIALLVGWAILGRPLYATVMTHDVFIFIDAAHRIQSGLRPHLDFVTGLGALNFYGPALWGLVDDPFRSFALFHVLALVVVLVLAAYAALTRALDAFAGVALMLYVGAVAGSPSNLGDPAAALTFAMWYNRLCWALLLIVLVLFLAPRHGHGATVTIGDATAILVLGVAGFYLKITFATVAAGLAGLAFLTVPHLRRPVLLAAVGAGLTLLWVELAVSGLHAAYLRDLRDIGAVNGVSLLDPVRLLPDLKTLYEVTVATAAAGLYAGVVGRAGQRDLGLFVTILVTSNYLYSTNIQQSGLVGLAAVPLLAYVRVAASPDDAIRHRRLWAGSLAITLVAFTAPEAATRYLSLINYAAWSHDNAYPFAAPQRLADGLIAADAGVAGTHSFLARLDAGESPAAVLAEREAYRHRHPIDQAIYQVEYAYMIAQGAAALERAFQADPGGRGPVIVLDFANAISPALDLPPSRGDFAWFHEGRNIDAEHHPRPDELFRNARYVMAPNFSTTAGTRDFLLRLYGTFLSREYVLVVDGLLWRIWSRRES